MPPLVDNPPFIPPPQGASNGGQPGYYPPFSGSFHPSWPPPITGTPYPTVQTQLPNWPLSPNDPPTSAQSWTYGNYPPAPTPTWGPPPPQAPAWGQTPNTTWGMQTPGGTWGMQTPGGTWAAPSPVSYGAPQTPYSPWVQQPQPQQSYFNNPPGTPFDSASGQPITAGWFGAGNQGAVGGRRERKKSVAHRSPMRRSNSQGPPNPRPLLQRSTSHTPGGTFQYPYFSEPFDAQNLARRPLDWRPDFDARAGLASYIPRVGKVRSDVQEYTDPIRRILHPLLLHTPNQPPVYHDLRDHPLAFEYIEFRNLQRDHNDIDFAQLVLQPSCPFIRLFHPRLPWYIDIHQSHPNGVTVYDVFTQMNQQLHIPIQGKHYWTEDLGESDRTLISAAFQARCKGDPGQITTGVLRVDFLGKKPIFEGLVRSSKGLWEIKTTKT
ncbi:hypothetical protein BYT27DRAFT_7225080 [Phlegmacium glaucopus]|nr:hypothetical protein BYT27DRAFT_7225080 [Phlegmacium glaucopus]